MSAVSFLATVSPSGSGSSRETPTKEKQQDDRTLKKGTLVFVKMMRLYGYVVCWHKYEMLENLMSFA